MPETQVRSPSGGLVTVRHPEGATDEQILAYARQQAEVNSAETDNPPANLTAADMPSPFFSGGMGYADMPSPTPETRAQQADRNILGVQMLGKGAGTGVADIGRGLGLLEQLSPEERQKFEQLAKRYPEAKIGQVLGQAAPWIVPGLAAANIASLPVRVLALGGLGGTEANVIARGTGQSGEQIFEATTLGIALGALPDSVGAAVNSGFRQLAKRLSGKTLNPLTPSGLPTPEFQDVLKRANIDFADLEGNILDAIKTAPDGADMDQVLRSALFESEGIPAFRSNITQSVADEGDLDTLIGLAGGNTPAAETARSALQGQSDAFRTRVKDFVDGLGLPDEVGESVKDALGSRKALLREQKNALYKEVADNAEELAQFPIFSDDIKGALPSIDDRLDMMDNLPSQMAALDSALNRFGIIDKPDLTKKLVEAGGQVQPLTLGNYDRLRKSINRIERSDQTGQIKVITGPIKEALDNEVDTLVDSVVSAGSAAPEVIGKLRQAQSLVRNTKREFSPQSIVGRLTDTKRDGVTDIVDASRVSQKLLTSGAPIENLRSTLKSLRDSGAKGGEAVRNMQAAVVLQALENTLKAPTRKINGVQTVAGAQFRKELDKIGRDKIELLFRNNKPALQQLNRLSEIGNLMNPSSFGTAKGGGPALIGFVRRLSNSVPGLGDVVEGALVAKDMGTASNAARRALDAKPQITKNMDIIANEYPALASALGLAVYVNKGEEENE